MSNEDIFEASRDGNLERVKYLVEIEKVNINYSQVWVIKYDF